MGYKLNTKIRIDLGELGDNNGTPFFVEIKNPKMLTFGQSLNFGKLAQAKDPVEQAKFTSEMLSDLIVAWNLIDMETEQPVDLKDEKAFEKIPSGEVFKMIFNEIKPKQDDQTKNLSEQSDRS